MTVEVDTPLGTFKTSLKAARRVNSLGGMMETTRRLASFDLDAYVVVAAAGLDQKPNEVEDQVFDAGMPALVDSFSEFVGLLTNGEKPLKAGKA